MMLFILLSLSFSLLKKLDELKLEMRKEVEEKYSDFLLDFDKTSTTVDQLEVAVGEVEALTNMVNTHLRPEVAQATKDMHEVGRQLQELSATVEVIRQQRKWDKHKLLYSTRSYEVDLNVDQRNLLYRWFF